ncbi:hypothetical protein SCH4B_3876 [Ruegeria sp. TrichCH4B]|nr:hypothetical protein SCH4B_3876 [Ruegeria sp. TrichCH4B]
MSQNKIRRRLTSAAFCVVLDDRFGPIVLKKSLRLSALPEMQNNFGSNPSAP